MARIERISSEQTFDVEQAQLIDPSGFRFSTAGAEAMQQIGGTLFELGKRELAAKNSLAVNAASESRRLAKLKMEEFIKNNPDPDTWSEGARNIIEEQVKTYSQQRFNQETGEQQEIEQKAFIDGLNMEVGIAAVAQNIENDIAINGKNLIDVISTDDGTPDAADEIDKQIELYQEALERKYDKEVAALYMEETLKEAQKQQIENAKKEQMNLAAVNPEQITNSGGTGTIDIELKLRRKGQKPSQEFALLSNTDLEAIRDYANSVGEKAVSDSKIAADAAVRASYGNIINGGTDITEMAELILADPTITDDDKIAAVNKIKTFFTTWNSAIKKEDEKEDIVTSNSTRIKALRIIKAVKTGKLTDDEGIEVYETLAKVEEINGKDGQKFIEDIFAAGEAARSVERKRQNDILAGREKQLRDAIEKQQNILQPDLATEILKDFANIAVIELNDAFREGDFTKEEVDIEVNRLLNRFTLSEAQQQMAVNARSLRLAKSLKEQQESITKLVVSLRAEGEDDAAKRVMDDAIRLGIFIDEGGTIKKGKKKTSVGKELIKRILDSIVE